MTRYKERECPGCESIGRRPVDTLCPRCKQKLIDYNRIENELERLKLHQGKTRLFGERRLPMALSLGSRSDGKEMEAFRAAMFNLIDGLSPITKHESELPQGKSHYLLSRAPNDGKGRGWNPTFSFKASEDFGDRYDAFLVAMRELLSAVYYNGKKSGKNLLRQLNEGEISTNDFRNHR